MTVHSLYSSLRALRLSCLVLLLASTCTLHATGQTIIGRKYASYKTQISTAAVFDNKIHSIIYHDDTTQASAFPSVTDRIFKPIYCIGDTFAPLQSHITLRAGRGPFDALYQSNSNIWHLGSITSHIFFPAGGVFLSQLIPNIGLSTHVTLPGTNQYEVRCTAQLQNGDWMYGGNVVSADSVLWTIRHDPFLIRVSKQGIPKWVNYTRRPGASTGTIVKIIELSANEIAVADGVDLKSRVTLVDSNGVVQRTDTIDNVNDPGFFLIGSKTAFSPDSSVVALGYNYDNISRTDHHVILYKYDYYRRRLKWRKRLPIGTPQGLYVNEQGRIFFSLLDNVNHDHQLVVMNDSSIVGQLPIMDTISPNRSIYINDYAAYDDSTTIAFGNYANGTRSRATYLYIKGMGKRYNPITSLDAYHRSGKAEHNNQLKVYPNPASNMVTLASADTEPINLIHCYDTQGRLVLTADHLRDPAATINLPLTLQVGLYHLRATTTSGKGLYQRLVVR